MPTHTQWPAGVAPGIGRSGAALVVNADDDSVDIVDLETLEEVARVPVGLVPLQTEWPVGVAALSPSRLFALLAHDPPGPAHDHGSGQSVHPSGQVVEVTLGSARRRVVEVGPTPSALALSKDGRRLYVGHFDIRPAFDTEVITIDTESMAIVARQAVCPGIAGLAALADGRVAIACFHTDSIALLDTGDGSVVRFEVGDNAAPPTQPARYGPRALHLHPDGNSLWVSLERSREVTAHRLDSPGSPRRFAVDGTPLVGAFADDGDRFIVAVAGVDDAVATVDVSSGAVTHAVLAGRCEEIRAVAAPKALGDDALALCDDAYDSPGHLLRFDVRTGEGTARHAVGVTPTALVTVGAL